MSKKKGIARTLSALVAAGLLSCAMASVAFAAESHPVSTQLTPGATSTVVDGGTTNVNVNVLDFEGAAGETMFVTALVNGSPVAEYMPYVLGSDRGSAEGQSADALAIELDKDSLSNPPSIEVTVFSDRADKTGTTYPVHWVYASLDDGKTELIGSCTEGATFVAPEKIQVGSKAYKLKGQSSGDSYSYDYEAYDPGSTVEGVVRYVNVNPAAGEDPMLSYHTPIPGLKEGEPRTVAIPKTITEGGAVYSTLSFTTSVTAQYPADTSFTIPVVKMGESTDVVPHAAIIEMVADGEVIASDGVMVKSNVLYTAPSNIYKTQPAGEDGTQVFAYELAQEGTISLTPNGSGDDETVTVQYKRQDLDTAEVEVTFNQVDGQERTTSAARKLGSATKTATGSNPVVTAKGLKTPEGYELVGAASDYSYGLNSNKIPVVDVYYVPSGYQVPGSYNVTVNYVNFYDRSVIDSETFESKVSDVVDMKFTAPERFSSGGVDWVRLGGQEEPIRHNYYSQNKTYTVYYRDASQELESAPVITQVRTLYEEQQVAAATPAAGTAAAGAAAAGGEAATTTAALNDGTTYNVPGGEGVNPTATAQDGRTATQERIEDDAVALSDGLDSAPANEQQGFPIWAIPVAIAVLAAIGGIAFFVSRRRNGNGKA